MRKMCIRMSNTLLLLFCAVLVFCCTGCGSERWEGPNLEKQRLQTESISNARQLAGYPAADGKQVKDGVLLRSGMLYDASLADIEKLKEEYGLCVIIDLRTSKEVAAKPDPVIEGVRYYHLPLMEEDADESSQAAIIEIYRQYEDDPGRAYVEMIRAGALSDEMYTAFLDSEDALKAWRQFFDILLEQKEGSVLWHCSGGKDRAGLTAAMILSILGVDEKTILADFTLTNEVLYEKIAYITNEAAKYTSDKEELEQISALIGVSAAHMQKVFDRAQAECGSLSAFVRTKIGLTDAEVQMLRQRYLE